MVTDTVATTARAHLVYHRILWKLRERRWYDVDIKSDLGRDVWFMNINVKMVISDSSYIKRSGHVVT